MPRLQDSYKFWCYWNTRLLVGADFGWRRPRSPWLYNTLNERYHRRNGMYLDAEMFPHHPLVMVTIQTYCMRHYTSYSVRTWHFRHDTSVLRTPDKMLAKGARTNTVLPKKTTILNFRSWPGLVGLSWGNQAVVILKFLFCKNVG